jgi:hypothetical protein
VSHRPVRYEAERVLKFFRAIGLRVKSCVCTRVIHERSVQGLGPPLQGRTPNRECRGEAGVALAAWS